MAELSFSGLKQMLRDRQLVVLSFVGYSGAAYEHPEAMLENAGQILADADPAVTLINIGATAAGIGAVYPIAKSLGLTTLGIVSTLAQTQNVTLSAYVDHIVYIQDEFWGGRLEGSTALSPTSAAIVEISERLVGIGGGDVTRDELQAARLAGKAVTFIPAEMNHQRARARAKRLGQPEPLEFKGSAHRVFAAEC